MNRTLGLAATGAVCIAVLVPLGRWEGARAIEGQLRGIMRVHALAGGRFDSNSLSGYRVTPTLACLLYGVDGDPYALELCFDQQGRLVEAVDRRKAGRPRFSSIRYEPEAARRMVPIAELARILRSVGAAAPPDRLPEPTADVGPHLRREAS